MKAFHNDKRVKDKYVKRVLAHQKADKIIQGDQNHCAVGCTLDGNYDHNAYEVELGIPEWLARVEDRIFEGMEKKHALLWPAKFLEAITPGQDLDKIKIPFLIFIVESAREKFDHAAYPKQLAAIDGVLKKLKKKKIDFAKLREARAAAAANAAAAAADAAYAAYAAAYAAAAAAAAAAYAAYAAYAAAAAAAAYAAYAADAAYAAYAAADAAYAAAAAAAAYAADAAARRKEYKKFADKLIELIKEYK